MEQLERNSYEEEVREKHLKIMESFEREFLAGFRMT